VERVLRYATEAGIAAARTGAHTQAAEFFTLALEHGKPQAPQARADLLERLAAEQYVLDRLDEAISSATQAMNLRVTAEHSRRPMLARRARWSRGAARAFDRIGTRTKTALGISRARLTVASSGHSPRRHSVVPARMEPSLGWYPNELGPDSWPARGVAAGAGALGRSRCGACESHCVL